MGADPNVKDVYVEVDWMRGITPPSGDTFKKIVEEFARHNIRLHIDAGPDSIDYVTGRKWSTYPGGSGGGEIPYVNEANTFSRIRSIANTYFKSSRTRAFHYCVFAENLGGAGGVAYLQSQLFTVLGTMSDWAKGAAFMHELGHNLNLQHGGDDAQNNKPNYLSNMNYIFAYSDDLAYKYSDFDLFDLDENDLNEPYGVDPTGLTAGTGIHTALIVNGRSQFFLASKTPLDYNHNGSTTDTHVRADLANKSQATQTDNTISYDVLTSQNDWDALVFKGQNIGTVGATVGVTFEPNEPGLVSPDEPKIDDLRNIGLFPAKAEGNTAGSSRFFKLWGKVTEWEKTPLNWILLIVFFGWIWMAF
jgi:hypothetical protein